MTVNEETRDDIELVKDPDRRDGWLLRVGQADQSHVDLADPLWLEFDYIAKIAMIVDAVHEAGAALRVIHIGGAAMTYARYLAISRPRSPQIVLEPDEYLTEYVRRHLPLPRRRGIRVRPVAGEVGIAQMPDDYADVVVIDAFVADQVPAALGTVEFFTELARILRADGVVVGNYPDRKERRYWPGILAGMHQCWNHIAMGAEPAVLKGRRFGNALLAASAEPLPVEDLARKTASAPLPYRIIGTQRINELFACAEPFTVERNQSSPPATGFLS